MEKRGEVQASEIEEKKMRREKRPYFAFESLSGTSFSLTSSGWTLSAEVFPPFLREKEEDEDDQEGCSLAYERASAVSSWVIRSWRSTVLHEVGEERRKNKGRNVRGGGERGREVSEEKGRERRRAGYVGRTQTGRASCRAGWRGFRSDRWRGSLE